MFLKFKNVNKSYRLGETTVTALRNLNFEMAPSSFMTIVGASGSGKSTLLNLAGTLDDVDSGEIIFDGVNINQLNADQKSELRSQKIGFIFQSFNLIPVLSVFENVELPILLHNLSKKQRQDRVEKVLEEVGLKNFSKQRPDQLSGGQRQRVAIARALVTEAQLIIADEPTANLDSETTHRIIDLLLELNQKKGVSFLFSTHDEKLMTRVTRIVRLKDGQIIDSDQTG